MATSAAPNLLQSIWLQLADTLQKTLEIFRHLPPRQWIGRIGCHLHGGRLILD